MTWQSAGDGPADKPEDKLCPRPAIFDGGRQALYKYCRILTHLVSTSHSDGDPFVFCLLQCTAHTHQVHLQGLQDPDDWS